MITKDLSGIIDLEKIAASGQCFRWLKTGERAFTIPAFGKELHISQDEAGRLDADCGQEEWEQVWRTYFDLDTDYHAICCDIAQDDPYLRAAAKAGQGITILRQDFFETLISFIVSQNNNIPRIKKILNALCAFGSAERHEDKALCRFPAPEQIAALSEEELLHMGLGYRAGYVKETAAKYARDPFFADENEPTFDVTQRLMEYKGVGIKVASCVALFGLGRKDAFPVDVWVRRILDTRYQQGFPMERYARFAGVYQQYMFYYERLLSGV